MTVSLNSIYNGTKTLEMEGNDACGESAYTDDRSIQIQGDHVHPKLQDSVFISGPHGFCIELDRRAFIDAVKEEFGLVEIPSTFEEFAAGYAAS